MAWAALLVASGALLIASHQLNHVTGKAVNVTSGLFWGLFSAGCFGARGATCKYYKLKETTLHSPMMSAVLVETAILAILSACSTDEVWAVGFQGASVPHQTCLPGIMRAASSPYAIASGAAWFAYQWASFAMLDRVTPVTHTILNNAKRAFVTLVMVAVFPSSFSFAFPNVLGLVLMVYAIAVLGGCERKCVSTEMGISFAGLLARVGFLVVVMILPSVAEHKQVSLGKVALSAGSHNNMTTVSRRL